MSAEFSCFAHPILRSVRLKIFRESSQAVVFDSDLCSRLRLVLNSVAVSVSAKFSV